MKKFLISLTLICAQVFSAAALAQETVPYFLPKTELKFKMLVEKTSFTPGEFAIYSERYLRKEAPTQKYDDYRILDIEMTTAAIPDSLKYFELPVDKKHTIFSVERNDDGVLLAINAQPKRHEPVLEFKPAKRKNKALNPRDFMSEDILMASSTAKMAELTAREIYDIRSSRSELSRGDADYMPKDGEQLRLMMATMEQQEKALTQTFLGSTVSDTLMVEFSFVPEEEGRSMLFRFSKKLGMVDIDDLGGAPYYIEVKDLHQVPEILTEVEGMKPSREPGVAVNMPGRIKLTIMAGNEEVKSFEALAAQFGSVELLSANFFGKKILTRLVLNPVNGNVEQMEFEPLD